MSWSMRRREWGICLTVASDRPRFGSTSRSATKLRTVPVKVHHFRFMAPSDLLRANAQSCRNALSLRGAGRVPAGHDCFHNTRVEASGLYQAGHRHASRYHQIGDRFYFWHSCKTD